MHSLNSIAFYENHVVNATLWRTWLDTHASCDAFFADTASASLAHLSAVCDTFSDAMTSIRDDYAQNGMSNFSFAEMLAVEEMLAVSRVARSSVVGRKYLSILLLLCASDACPRVCVTSTHAYTPHSARCWARAVVVTGARMTETGVAARGANRAGENRAAVRSPSGRCVLPAPLHSSRARCRTRRERALLRRAATPHEVSTHGFTTGRCC